MNKNPIELIENQEVIQKLIDAGFGDLIDVLLSNQKCYTKKNRLNKSSACRILKCKSKQLEDALQACRELLSKEFDD